MSKNVKTALIIGGIIVAVLIILSSVFALNWGWQGGGRGMMGGFSWWFPIFMILFWGGWLYGVLWLWCGSQVGQEALTPQRQTQPWRS